MKKLLSKIVLLSLLVCLIPNVSFAADTHSIELVSSSSQYLSVNSNLGVNGNAAFSMSGWVKITSQPSSGTSVALLGTASTGGTDNYSWLGYRNESGTPRLQISTGYTVVATYNQTLTTDTWYHLAFTRTSGNSYVVYLNGSQVSTGSTAIQPLSTNKTFIGAAYNGTELSDAKIDEVRAWDKVLSASEVASQYNRELPVPMENLIGYWKLDNDLTDETSGGNTLTNNGSATFSTDVPDLTNPSNFSSLDLNGSSQYLSITDASQTGLDLTTDFSLECWVKLEQLPSSAGDNFTLIAKDDIGVSRAYEFIMLSSDKVALYYFSDNSTYSTYALTTAITSADVGTWVHWAVTVDISSKTILIYRNGVSQSVTAGPLNSTTVQNSSAPFTIGAQLNSSSPTFFTDGLIDDVRVWNTERTPTEIANNYNLELEGTETGLQGYWTINGDFLDLTSNDNDLTNNNSATFSTDTPFPTETIQTYTSRTSAVRVGEVGGASKQVENAQSFITNYDGQIETVKFLCDTTFQVGSNSDGLNVAIQGDNSGVPDGTDIESVNVPHASLGNSILVTVDFSSTPVSTTGKTLYWVVISRQGSLDNSNYYRIAADNTEPYANGDNYYWDGDSWETFAAYDLATIIYNTTITESVRRIFNILF